MKIKRHELINIIKEKLDDADRARMHRYAVAQREYREKEAKYFQDTRADWMMFAETIERVVSHGKIMREDLVPEGIMRLYGAMRFFDAKPPIEPTPGETDTNLRNLITVLEQTTDEEVSTYSLEKMGFTLGRLLK